MSWLRWLRTVAATGAALALVAGIAAAQATEAVALVGARVVDGRGGDPIEDGVVIVEGSRITEVGPRKEVEVPAGAERIDLAGRTVIPGMIESNGHIVFSGQIDHAAYFAREVARYEEIGARHLGVALRQGITTLRDTHGPEPTLLRLRERQRSGALVGSRLFTSGAILNYESLLDIQPMAGAEMPSDASLERRARRQLDRFIDTQNAVEAVHAAQAVGVDFVKVSLSGYPDPQKLPQALDDETLGRMLAAARGHGLRTTSHTMNLRDLERAVALGFDSLEHPAFTLERGRAVELPMELARCIAREEIFSIPLLVAMETNITHLEEPERLDDPGYVAGLDPLLVDEARRWVEGTRVDAAASARRQATYDGVRRNLARLIEVGAPIAMGTDKGTRLNFHEHANHVRELEIYVELGMTPLEAITSATLRGAQLLGVEDRLGTIEPGKVADLVVVDGDPTHQIRDVGRVVMVFQDGRRIP